ncbi:hypothetical protein G9A89_013170 [Geosiphon pyriformis]|nr:hypothetical protein G9A89_013170 [Geosiphon pyriformis]
MSDKSSALLSQAPELGAKDTSASQPAKVANPTPTPASTSASASAPASTSTATPAPAPAPATDLNKNRNEDDNSNNESKNKKNDSPPPKNNSSSPEAQAISTAVATPTTTANSPTTSLIPTLTVPTNSSTELSAQSSSTLDPLSTSNGNNNEGGASAGVMIGGMMVATLVVVVLITMIVRRKIRVIRSSSPSLKDSGYNDAYMNEKSAYYNEKDSIPHINKPDSIFVDPSNNGGINYGSRGNGGNLSPMPTNRLSIYRQSTGGMYDPPTSLIPVNGRYTPALSRQPSTNSYINYYGGNGTGDLSQPQQQYYLEPETYYSADDYTASVDNYGMQMPPLYPQNPTSPYDEHRGLTSPPPPGHAY